MKKLLLIVATLFSIVTIALANFTKENTSELTNNVLGTIEVNMDEVTFPWTISVPAPPKNVVEFEGPCGANAGVMNVSNGILSITFNNNAGLLDLYEAKGDYFINIRTHDFDVYTIIIRTI